MVPILFAAAIAQGITLFFFRITQYNAVNWSTNFSWVRLLRYPYKQIKEERIGKFSCSYICQLGWLTWEDAFAYIFMCLLYCFVLF